jgi:hypothetical protein
MCLLNRRFKTPLDYSSFQPPKIDKVWGWLYSSYRGAITHGRKPTFNKKFFKDQQATVSFLDEATKALLRHALEEPDLILDLQAC